MSSCHRNYKPLALRDNILVFFQDSTNKERLLNCVYNFLSNEFDYNAKIRRDEQNEHGDIKQMATAALT